MLRCLEKQRSLNGCAWVRNLRWKNNSMDGNSCATKCHRMIARPNRWGSAQLYNSVTLSSRMWSHRPKMAIPSWSWTTSNTRPIWQKRLEQRQQHLPRSAIGNLSNDLPSPRSSPTLKTTCCETVCIYSAIPQRTQLVDFSMKGAQAAYMTPTASIAMFRLSMLDQAKD